MQNTASQVLTTYTICPQNTLISGSGPMVSNDARMCLGLNGGNRTGLTCEPEIGATRSKDNPNSLTNAQMLPLHGLRELGLEMER